MKRYSLRQFFQDFYLALILIFLYAPIFTMMVLSFNNTKSRTLWGGFTTRWYSEMFESQAIMAALYNTLLIAFISALVATIIGTVAAIGISSMKKVPRTIVMGINNIPMLNSDIVTGISLMLAFIAFGISLGFKTILIAHISFNIPYVILSVMPKLKQTSRNTYEAALDLGASPLQAFFKVVFPDILPGVLSGFLMAFTMSLDDFIITHFTKGAGINTLSTLIYSEVRRGIKPSMYALSTLIFATVLILLLITNFSPEASGSSAASKNGVTTAEETAKARQRRKKIEQRKKTVLAAATALVLAIVGLSTYERYSATHSKELYVYNWGEYIDETVVEQFEEETGIKVTYDQFETNEEMYPIIEAGAVNYDVVCPSDYMIQKMVENDLLAEINFDNIPNIENIDPKYMEMSREFDPENKYSVPYTWGTVGILYNTRLIEEKGLPVPTRWSDLWNPAYKGEILMQDSVRDAFMVALKSLGYSMNTENIAELQEARQLLIDQKPLVQAYVIDQVRDKMIGGEAAIGVIYSGEMLYIQEEVASQNLDYTLEYVIPEEGTNLWLDSWVIPANAKNKENAEKWIDFLCRPDIALKNFEYITYATPNKAAKELLDEDLQNNKAVFPDFESLENCEVFRYLGDEADGVYNSLWKEVKSQ
ncbi:MAG: extracellular solute-binding protein [Otoolea sp.]|nr:extracellular solute-binding protein [Clostridiaceae bacterium]MDD6073802.1 extracellular solute-binding protein [Clostridium sp.]